MSSETPESVAMEYLDAAEGVQKTALMMMALQILTLEIDIERCRGMVGRGYVRAKPREIAAINPPPPSILLAEDDP